MRIYQVLFGFVFIIIVSVINSNLIEAYYYQFFSNNKLKIYSGTPLIEYNLSIDLTSNKSWFFMENETESSILVNTQEKSAIRHNIRESEGLIIQDTFAFTNSTNASIIFTFVMINNRSALPTYDTDGVIGLSFEHTNIEFSLLHQLKYNHLISHLSFSIHNTLRTVVFGGIPEKFTAGKNYSYCNVIGRNDNWNCLISSVIIQNKTNLLTYSVPKGSVVTFTTLNHVNCAPKSFYNLLINQLYREHIENKIYKIIGNGNRIYTVDGRNIIDAHITFIIGDYAYNISISNFWDCYEEGCDFELVENDCGEDWMLGSKFISIFNTHFDYEERKIHFYSNKRINVNKIDKTIIPIKNQTIAKTFYTLGMLVLIAGLMGVILIKIKI